MIIFVIVDYVLVNLKKRYLYYIHFLFSNTWCTTIFTDFYNFFNNFGVFILEKLSVYYKI
jgi:hypothetical protein